MYRVAEKEGRLLWAGLNRRFAPAYVKFHSLVSPFVAPCSVLYLEKFYGGFDPPRRPLEPKGYLEAIHQADLAVWIGGAVKKVEGVSVTHRRAVTADGREGHEGRLCAVLTHRSGLRTFLTVGHRVTPVAEHPLNLERAFFTTSGRYVDQYDFRRVTVSAGPKSETFDYTSDELGFLAQARAFVKAVKTGKMPYPPKSYLESHRIVFDLPGESENR
jgi:predicted dehydrogenase